MSEKTFANRIDDAIRNEWIKVYYQPVIRTLTGELCGFESLARWIDPEMGFLSPAEFIGALEDCEMIYKLDIFMVEKVCYDIHERLFQNKEIVPVSINFSRLDFLTCDMLEVVENAVNKYDIPRDYLHIEITESMMITDGDFMQGVIEGFRKRGYAVWMDDFGSGYSSLNLLKDFDIDVMKMDMSFLSSMNPKSKAIMKSLITMAKDINIMTLAEGVETEEEVEFLKEIGCGRLQGYFYGKPLPLEEAFANLRDKGIETEERKWNHFYDAAESHVRSTDTPLELVLDDGKTFKTLFMNDDFKLQIFDDLPELDQVDKRLYVPGSPLSRKLREFAKAVEKSKKQETFYFTTNGNFFCIRCRTVAEYDGCYIVKASINNLSIDERIEKREGFDIKLRELNNLFVVVLMFNLEEQSVTPILGRFKLFKGPEKMEMHKSTEIMANAIIHPNDRQRYTEFMNADTFEERVGKSPFGFIEEPFRFKNEDGNYRWASTTILMMPGSEGKQYLYCVKPLSPNTAKILSEYGTAVGEHLNSDEFSLLWYNIIWNSSIKFFWKDKDLKYLGASNAFLKYFKIGSVDDIIGKRGEEMPWHLEQGHYHSAEKKVIREGKNYYVETCQCLIEGVVHNTATSKMPVYRDGEIVGLMGYIIDVDEARKNLGFDADSSKTDEITGLGNTLSFVETMIDFSNQYHMNGKDFGLIVLKNIKYQRILEAYGKPISDGLLQAMADEIEDVIEDSGMIARTKESCFAVVMHCSSCDELIGKAEKLKSKIEAITNVDGMEVTIKIAYSVCMRSDAGITDEGMYASALDLISNANP